MQSVVGLRYTRRPRGQGLWEDGTVSLPGGAFASELASGVRRIGTNQWSLVAGGADAMIVRKGTRWQQITWGNYGYLWTAGDGVLTHIHHLTNDSAGGTIVGLTSEITVNSATEPAGGKPDSSGISAIIYQDQATADGAIRAFEGHAIRGHASAGASATGASAMGMELGIHTLAAGNASFGTGGQFPKTMLLFGASYSAGGFPGAVRADVGYYLWGAAGVKYGFFHHDTNNDILVYSDQVGRVYAGGGATGSNAAAPAFGILTGISTGAKGMFDAGNDSLGFSALGTEVARAGGLTTAFNAFRVTTGLELGGIISPTQLAANTDNYTATNIGISSILRLSTDASRNLTGIVAPTGSVPRVLTICNVGSFNLVLTHDATSTAANRFLLPNSANLTLLPNMSVMVFYDATSTRWRCLSGFVS